MSLTCVKVSLPSSLKGLEHVNTAVNDYLIPPTLDGAVRNGCLGVLERFKTNSCTTDAMDAALDNHHYSTIQWLVLNTKLAPKSLIVNNALKCAAEQGVSEAVELLATHCSAAAIERALAYAARKEKWQVVQLLYRKCTPGCAALGGALKIAASRGQRDVVELLWSECDEKDVARSLEGAAEEIKWDVVEFLYLHCSESKELGKALLCAVEKAHWDMVKLIYPRCREKDLVEALNSVVIRRHWDVAKLLCEKLQKEEYQDALQLVDKDEGRLLLDRLYKRCRCYDAEKAITEATKQFNWTAIKLLADTCYKESANVDKAFKLAVEMQRWDVVKRLYRECSNDAVSEAMKHADACGKHDIVHILMNNSSTTGALGRLSLRGDHKREQSLRCLAPGFDPFDIDVRSVNTIGDLKKLLHAERPEFFGDVSADSIRLYLAKRGDEWLSEDSEDMELLAMGDSSRVWDLLGWQVMSTRRVKYVFKGELHGNTVHLIALKPILRCIIPGSRPFGINVDAIKQMKDFKEVIKAEMTDLTRVDTSEIQLYLAKENGKWLSSSSDAAKALMVGESCPSFQFKGRGLISVAQVGNPFADVFAIHVIVQSPGMNLGVSRDIPSSTRFRLDELHARLHNMR